MNFKKIYIFKIICKCHQIIVGLMLISLYGCSTFRPDRWYLHNPVNKELADQAKSNWTPVQANLWQSLLKNQKLTSSAELQAQLALQQAVVSSKHLEIINMTWSEMLETAKEYEKKLSDEKKNIENEKKIALENSTKVGEEIKKLIDINGTRDKAAKEAERDQWRWQAELILFEKATQEFLLQQAIKNRDIESVKPKNTKEIFESILKEEIVTGKDTTTGKDIKVPISKLLDPEELDLINTLANNNDLSGWAPFIKKHGKQLDRITEQDLPGITFQILSLGASLSKAQLDREKAIKNRLDEEIALFAKREEEINKALKWVDKICNDLEHDDSKSVINNTVFNSIQKSLKVSTTPDTEGLIRYLQEYVLAEDLYTISDNSYEISKQALLHYYAIEDSAISAREHEALIQSGLETLAVYHNGGITQEEINTILQAAQAVALGVISAGVN